MQQIPMSIDATEVGAVKELLDLKGSVSFMSPSAIFYYT